MDIVEVDTTQGIKPALITLLQDSVASGASVGFLPPLTETGARLLAGHRDGAGRGQPPALGRFPATPAGRRPPALAVHQGQWPSPRRGGKTDGAQSPPWQGVGSALMASMEQGAKEAVQPAGARHPGGRCRFPPLSPARLPGGGPDPRLARSADGTLAATLFFYKQL